MITQAVKMRVLALAAVVLAAAIAFAPQGPAGIQHDFSSRSVDSSRSLAAR